VLSAYVLNKIKCWYYL